MLRLLQHTSRVTCAPGVLRARGFIPSVSRSLNCTAYNASPSNIVLPCLNAVDLNFANQLGHVSEVAAQLQRDGILKIVLGFKDDDSRYLEQLLLSLHKHYGHRIPISHSATRGWFWDVRPTSVNLQPQNPLARSETMAEFPWHTDCSYENPPPRYFALQVLQHDRFGGGTLSVMNIERLSDILSADAVAALKRPEYRFTIPPEFLKESAQKCIVGSLLGTDKDGRSSILRFREDIVAPLNKRASEALQELNQAVVSNTARVKWTTHLTARDLPKGTILLLDNRRWLHRRSEVKDPHRHLRRVRWDAIPFPSSSK
ncbi:Clavaminate synthase-like protein [Thozetella sp. PMI_491]|nr:Clavaminate synthase-like protein [Thozetella sp. PMI_491]